MLLMSAVNDLGNGGANPYASDKSYKRSVLFIPAVFVTCGNVLIACCVQSATDSQLNFADVVSYKFNHFGALTELQEDVRVRREKHKTTASNYYQDLDRSKISVLLIFAVQLSLTILYIIALDRKIGLLSDTLVQYWLFGMLIQSLVVADASSAGQGFYREIPFWTLLIQVHIRACTALVQIHFIIRVHPFVHSTVPTKRGTPCGSRTKTRLSTTAWVALNFTSAPPAH